MNAYLKFKNGLYENLVSTLTISSTELIMEKNIANKGRQLAQFLYHKMSKSTADQKDLAFRIMLIFLPKPRLVIYKKKRLVIQNNNNSCVVTEAQCKWIFDYLSQNFRTFGYTSTAYFQPHISV